MKESGGAALSACGQTGTPHNSVNPRQFLSLGCKRNDIVV